MAYDKEWEGFMAPHPWPEAISGPLPGGAGKEMSVNGQAQAEPQTAWWICMPCGFIYDPEEGDPDGGIEPGTPFEDIPDDWMCPICGATKADFRELLPGEFPED